ncbi:type II toxin-antitoxin system RelE/ParE family toxin [Nitrospirillum sp. BR 11164]|uniref:type II toxin-antitoxin system RelE/ParE family toxin n=1 Tax=Nitrospirillum sp. BR 11164 TaxID=3104324 RepID=UPI002AFEA0C5|nr:type II toxin-antitoxin system RelE/ParE family toxin [Nitrospirillum sp. BR 11164]MEA1652333.1 type II toxin-antitoxin system RelE/ParE family toxin [Nitrospirillum sp. BR 11164]
MKIEWLPAAQREFSNQIIHLADRNPIAAVRIGDAVEAAVERLASYPHSGRPGRVPGTQELVITDTPYIVVYRTTSNVVVILRVLHGAQRWP